MVACSRMRCRRYAVGAAVVCITVSALLVGRCTGIPLPATLLERADILDNGVYYFAAKWVGVRGSGGLVVRAFTDKLGRRGYKLVNLVCRDREGRELSRVVNGNGVRLLCHANGAPGKLELFSCGLPTPYLVQWSEGGQVRAVGFVEQDTGNRVYWRYSDSGVLESAEKGQPDAGPRPFGFVLPNGIAAPPTGAAPPPSPAQQ